MYTFLWDSVNEGYLIETQASAIEIDILQLPSKTLVITISIIVKPPSTMLAAGDHEGTMPGE